MLPVKIGSRYLPEFYQCFQGDLMPWITCCTKKRHGGGRTGGGEVNGLLFHKDKAGTDKDGTQRLCLRCRLGIDAIKLSRFQPGDMMTLAFDPESRRVLIRRVTDAERNDVHCWKLISCNGKKSTGGALYFKAGQIDDKWMAVLFPNGSPSYTPLKFHFDNGIVCDWPTRGSDG